MSLCRYLLQWWKMARAAGHRQVPTMRPPIDNQLAPEDLSFFRPAKGMNVAAPLSMIPREFSPFTKNFILHRGHNKSRSPVGVVGGASVDPVMHAFEFRALDGTVFILRFTTKKLQRLAGSAWSDVAGATFTGTTSDFFTITTFGERLVFSNGVDGLFVFDPGAVTVSQITTSAEVPKARHLTTFAGRVVATNVIDSSGTKRGRVRWSAKFDHTKWDPAVDLGSGFEDVTSSPNPDADVCHATLPVTDELALLSRRRSVYLISVTGIADAPFRFSMLHDQLGTESPYSIVAVHGGIMGWYENDFYFVSHTGVTPVGTQIADRLRELITSPRDMWGTYDAYRNEYRCIIKEDSAVWRYSFPDQGWTRDEYSFVPRTIEAVGRYTTGGLTIDELVGTIDGLVGTIDELGGGAVIRGGAYLTQPSYVVREDTTRTQDVNTSGNAIDAPVEIQTGLILPKSPLERVEVAEVQLEYEANIGQTLIFDYSTDAGETWLQYSTIDIVPTSGPEVLSVRRTVSGKKMQVRCRSTTLGQLSLLSLHVFATLGGKIKP